MSVPQRSSGPRGNGPSAGTQRTNHTAWSSLLSSGSQSPWLKTKERNTGEGQSTCFHSKETDNKLHLFILITASWQEVSAGD